MLYGGSLGSEPDQLLEAGKGFALRVRKPPYCPKESAIGRRHHDNRRRFETGVFVRIVIE
jgi:hypothetical protein